MPQPTVPSDASSLDDSPGSAAASAPPVAPSSPADERSAPAEPASGSVDPAVSPAARVDDPAAVEPASSDPAPDPEPRVGGAATPSLLASLAPGTWPARTPPLAPASPSAPPPPSTRILGHAPQPPFEPAEAPYRWQTSLPGAIGRRVTIAIGDSGLNLGGQHIDFDDIESVRMSLEVEAALIHRRPSARMSVLMSRRDGHAVRASARSALSVANTNAIVHTLGYLWDVLGDTAGVRQREDIIGKIQRGGEALVGGLRLNRIGVAWKRNPIERWSEIGDPQIEKHHITIPTSAAPIQVSIGADDAYILPALIPQLRRRFR